MIAFFGLNKLELLEIRLGFNPKIGCSPNKQLADYKRESAIHGFEPMTIRSDQIV